MTISDLQPGCFGSALFYSVNEAECADCPSFATCGPATLERQKAVLPVVAVLDRTLGLERLSDVQKWFSRSHIRNVVKERSTVKIRALLERWSADGVNVYHLKHRNNPTDTPGLLHDTFAFMLEAGAFKPRDVVEHLRAHHDLTKKALTAHVKEVVEALTFASVLKKEHHVLCLS